MFYRLNRFSIPLGVVIIALVASSCSDSAQSQPAGYEVIHRIDNYNNATIEAVVSKLDVVPFSPDYIPQLTPVKIAPGLLKPTTGLTARETDAIKVCYEAGQILALINPNTTDVEAFHGLWSVGAAFASVAGPDLLAYMTGHEDDMLPACHHPHLQFILA